MMIAAAAAETKKTTIAASSAAAACAAPSSQSSAPPQGMHGLCGHVQLDVIALHRTAGSQCAEIEEAASAAVGEHVALHGSCASHLLASAVLWPAFVGTARSIVLLVFSLAVSCSTWSGRSAAYAVRNTAKTSALYFQLFVSNTVRT